MRLNLRVPTPPGAWTALADPAVLAASLPGCRSAAAVDGGVRVVVDVAVASVRGLWAGTAVPTDDGGWRVVGSGEPGPIDLVLRFDPGGTTLTVEGTVEGPLATIGSALLAAAVRRLAEDLAAAR